MYQDDILQIKEESEDAEVDIGPTTLEHMDSHCGTNQQVTSVVKLESAAENNNVDSTLLSEVKQESSEIELIGGVDAQRCPGAKSTPAVAGNAQQGIHITVEGTNLVIVPTVLQHRTDQQNTSVGIIENTITYDGNDPILCHMVKEESVKDKCGEVTGSHFYNNVTPSEQYVCSVLYSCDKCVQTFTSNDIFRQHYRLAHSTEPYQCKIQIEINEELESYFHVQTTHSGSFQYECTACKKIYKSEQCLNDHVLDSHLIDINPKVADAESKVYICKICGETEMTRGDLRNHVYDIHGQLASPFVNRCCYCQCIYSEKKNLNAHIRKKHGFQRCSICREEFKSKELLYSHHKLVHPVVEPCALPSVNRCVFCQKIYCTKKYLGIHIRKVHGEGFRVCPDCKAGFESEDQLQGHIKLVHSKQEHEECNMGEDSSATTQDVVVMKEEPADEELELGPVVLQPIDRNYRPNEEEPQLD